MTTDTIPKEIAFEFEIGGKTCTIGGMCKGSGMIHPNMATMLCYITTDCDIDKALLQKMTSAIVTSIAKDLAITNNLKYFGLYYRKTNPILPMKPTFDDDLTKQKLELADCYSSQKKVCHNLGHMFPYENWISYDEWH